MPLNGWLPMTGEDYFAWVNQKMRLLERKAVTVPINVIEGAVDGSGGMDVEGMESYIEGVDDEYPSSPPPPGSLPPADVETGGDDDGLAGVGTEDTEIVETAGMVWASVESNTITTTGTSGYPSFTDWTIFDYGVGVTGGSAAHLFVVPPGLYMAKLYFSSLTITSPQSDLSCSANIFNASAFVTHEFPISPRPYSWTIGPLPVDESNSGQLSVSFYYPVTAGVPAITAGSCSYIIAKV